MAVAKISARKEEFRQVAYFVVEPPDVHRFVTYTPLFLNYLFIYKFPLSLLLQIKGYKAIFHMFTTFYALKGSETFLPV